MTALAAAIDAARRRPGVAAGLAVTLIVTCFWWPALFGGLAVLHSDAGAHGLPLMQLLTNWIWHGGAVSWSAGIYGGHPIFAEGQGGFADPLNLFFAACVTPLVGAVVSMNWFHAATMLLEGFGIVATCRVLGQGAASCVLAAVITILAPVWTMQQENVTISASLAALPWALCAAEYWAARPGAWRAAGIGASLALVVLGGYPQAAHAAVLYLAVRLALALPPGLSWRRLAAGVFIAAGVGLGLAAVQLVPLAQLVALSHRAGGVALPWRWAPDMYLRGLLFVHSAGGWNASFLGNVLAVALLPASWFAPNSRPARAHLAAVVFSVVLATEYANPLFPLLYEHDLVPGLHFFRLTQMYGVAACAGVGVLAGFAVEAMAVRRAARLAFLAGVAGSLGLAWHTGFRDMLPVVLAVLAIALTAVLAVPRFPARALTPLVAGLGVVVACVTELRPFPFLPRTLTAEPDTIKRLKAEPDWRAYRTLDSSALEGFALVDPAGSNYPASFRDMYAGFAGMSATLWGVDSLNGALALTLRRRELAEPVLNAELAGSTLAGPGNRLSDLLGVRYLAVSKACPPGTLQATVLATGPVLVCRNLVAAPRLQLFDHAVAAPSLEQALDLSAHGRALVVETTGALPALAGAAHASLVPEKLRDTEYRARVTTDAPVWLFVADADYPGWQATIDGADAPVFAAQVLGKAVLVPPGIHAVRFHYVPRAIYLGAAITGLTLLILGVAGAWPRAGRVRARHAV
jgi:hypothetical protein